MKKLPMLTEVTLSTIINGGQTLGTIDSGRKILVWGGLPGERVNVQVTRQKSSYLEGVVTNILSKSSDRLSPREPESYLSTSPWQIVSFDAEQHYKSQLIRDAFLQHHIELTPDDAIYSDTVDYGYRNKVEFSWYSATDSATGHDTLDLAFYRRGSKGKIPVNGTDLAKPEINSLARVIRDVLHEHGISARQLKTLLIRCDTTGNCAWQLYIKDVALPQFDVLCRDLAHHTEVISTGGEIIFSDPRSPASRITKRLWKTGSTVLRDKLLGVPFFYATEGFFQINLPIYERALHDMKKWIPHGRSVVDMYAGVGSIGLTIGGSRCALVEIDEHAVREMQHNITVQHSPARAVLAASEQALDYIRSDVALIVDPPRAGLHSKVVETIRQHMPPRIVYLSCNPVTQARDVALLIEGGAYRIAYSRAYNFFPRTPHIEHVVVLDAN